MSMRHYPVQGVGVFVKELDLKDREGFFEILDDTGCGEFFAETQPNGVMACINIATTEGNDGSDEYCLIMYNYRAYNRTPFDTFDNLKQFYIRALREHVNNTDSEVFELVDDIDSTSFG